MIIKTSMWLPFHYGFRLNKNTYTHRKDVVAYRICMVFKKHGGKVVNIKMANVFHSK